MSKYSDNLGSAACAALQSALCYASPMKASASRRAEPPAHTVDIAASLASAEQACQSHGLRFTDKRKRLLQALLDAAGPRSAYELADDYRKAYAEELPIMTVYRMLDVFVDVGLVHKLRSTSNFVACRHIACSHPHQVSQFLICDDCGLVREVEVAEQDLAGLVKRARGIGFELRCEQLELHGICEQCMAAQRSGD
jgi:Fur family zinc uptake transcriptional regulator